MKTSWAQSKEKSEQGQGHIMWQTDTKWTVRVTEFQSNEKIKERWADRELGGEIRSNVLLESPGIHRQLAETNGDWEKPLSYSGLREADDDRERWKTGCSLHGSEKNIW